MKRQKRLWYPASPENHTYSPKQLNLVTAVQNIYGYVFVLIAEYKLPSCIYVHWAWLNDMTFISNQHKQSVRRFKSHSPLIYSNVLLLPISNISNCLMAQSEFLLNTRTVQVCVFICVCRLYTDMSGTFICVC